MMHVPLAVVVGIVVVVVTAVAGYGFFRFLRELFVTSHQSS